LSRSFFAGHGIEIETQNFLLPADIPLIKWGRDSQLRREAISLAEMMIDLKARKPGLSVVILDACRNNPFLPEGGRNLGPGRGGLNSAQAAPNGVFILYSAGAGETALDRLDGDGEEKNSVYTRRLLPLMTTEGLTLGELARRVREDVSLLAASNSHPQTPAYYDGVLETSALPAVECHNRRRRRATRSVSCGRLIGRAAISSMSGSI